ncbi:pentatricopeptide repeat-containing protein [Pyrus ussuriensis x Pyrus communis]|uniref:Pentatricopeptide repeat-containing protein n=1 Tax=Pyrus ussuriensis x Pyrus communis TaxID=2448454 RepID=A0A5N5FYI2_9ROSA|nr:pentatricopeptide repeat-containing protein [Pyrus ussuriensis x Pyrus communis]
MLGAQLLPDDHIYPSVAKSCTILNGVDVGKSVHCLAVKTGYEFDVFVGSSVVDMYAKCGEIRDARKVFDEIPRKNVVSWSEMIYGYTQLGQDEEVPRLFKQAMVDEIPVKNLGMWNAMLVACAHHMHTNKALDLFKQMESAGMKLNFITFLCVLYACSHAGLVERGHYFFRLMKEYGIEPGEQHYATVVDLLCRAGKLQEAVKIIDKMPIEPTESIWGALLTGCRIHGDTELAASVADRVFELGPVSSGLRVLLSNAYAAAGRFEEAAKVRKMLRDRVMKKETGLSWVEEGNKIHTFAAGDRTHMRTKEIYEKLEELGEEMEKAGYVADTSFVLREVNREEKDQTIRYHSERLAVAFGLITFPPDRPISIMKNLRICGDCHTAIKFMSKCSGRVIIVGDNNRFHRFEDSAHAEIIGDFLTNPLTIN